MTTRNRDDDPTTRGDAPPARPGTKPPEEPGRIERPGAAVAAAARKPLDPEVAKAVGKVDWDFRTNMPPEAMNAASYVPPLRPEGHEPSPHDKDAVRIPDGRYRVEGSSWAFDFKGGKYVLAFMPQPPDYGGDDVIAVPPYHA